MVHQVIEGVDENKDNFIELSELREVWCMLVSDS